jgi:type IV pilus assembly protein PilV
MNRLINNPGNNPKKTLGCPTLVSARTQQGSQRGIALLEALVSILLFSMGVLALVGLQSTMIKNSSDSQYRSAASFIAQQWLGVMWADPTNPALYAIPVNGNWSVPKINTPNYDISSLLPNGTRTVSVSGVQATVTINWQQPGKDPHQLTTIAEIVAP